MNESQSLNSGAMPLALERQIDELCDEFEDALKRGIVPDPDGYLARVDRSAHRYLLCELTKLLRAYAIGYGRVNSESPSDSGAVSLPQEKAASRDCDSAVKPVGSTTRMHFKRSFEILQQLDDSGAHFVEALDRGELLKIEEIVAAAAPAARNRLLRQLLALEMEFRAKNGETPRLDEYRERFPDHLHLVKFLYFENYIPDSLGDFSIQRLLGSGGFGHVYQAWDSKLSRSVAIKVFRRDPEVVSPPGTGLLSEARAAAQLRHAGIVTVHAILPDSDGDEFLVMEFVDGRSLEDLLRSGPLPPRKAA